MDPTPAKAKTLPAHARASEESPRTVGCHCPPPPCGGTACGHYPVPGHNVSGHGGRQTLCEAALQPLPRLEAQAVRVSSCPEAYKGRRWAGTWLSGHIWHNT